MLATISAADLVAPVAEHIRKSTPQAEAERKLPQELFNHLKDAGLFSIYTSGEYGGLELPLPEALSVVEEVSKHDGSTGWTVALGIANALFPPILSPAAARQVLGNGSALIASAPAFNSRAVKVPGGYRVSGRWSFNSGAPNADWVATNAVVFEDGEPIMGANGPEMVFVFMPPTEVQTIDTWYVTGLRASGSQDLQVEEVFVPEELTGGFSLPEGPHVSRPGAFNNIPFLSLLAIAQSPPVCLGLGRRAIEEFKALALTKESMFGPRLSEQVQAQVGIARAESLVSAARSYWYDSVVSTWEKISSGRSLSLEELAGLRIASLTAAENAAEAIDVLCRLAGTTAIFQTSPLERCWRDVHTALQHLQVQDSRWETAGRVLLGLDPQSPLL